MLGLFGVGVRFGALKMAGVSFIVKMDATKCLRFQSLLTFLYLLKIRHSLVALLQQLLLFLFPVLTVPVPKTQVLLIILHMIHKYDIDNPKTIHDLLDLLMQEHPLDILKKRLGLIEDVVDLRECLLELMHRMLFLDVMQGALDI